MILYFGTMGCFASKPVFPIAQRALNLSVGILFELIFIIAICLANPVTCLAAEKYPHEVLSGTDIIDISKFNPSSDAKPGNYIAETGGAVLALVISNRGRAINLQRRFSEPGVDGKDKCYNNLIRFPDGNFKSRNIVLRFVDGGGVLVLEKASGVDEIPDSFWIYYTFRQSENKR